MEIAVIWEIASTVKLVAEVAVEAPVVTAIAPVLAVGGTATIRLVAVAAVTVAGTPLNVTALFTTPGAKPCP